MSTKAALIKRVEYWMTKYNEAVAELEQLRHWKAEALEVLRGYQAQELAVALDLPLGTQIGPQVLPAVEKLKARLASLAELPEDLRNEANTLGLYGGNGDDLKEAANLIEKALQP